MGMDYNEKGFGLEVYSHNTEGVLFGISRGYYPKCAIWARLDAGADRAELLQLAEEFYEAYFFYRLRLDLLENLVVARVCLEFATLEGKKKLITKLQKVVGSPLVGAELVEALDVMGTVGAQALLLEIIEHYFYFGIPERARWVMVYYRCL